MCAGRAGAPTATTTPGSLQLTDDRANSTGGAVYNTALPVNGGLEIRFDQYQYSSAGSGGEGMAVFLADGAQRIAAPGAGAGSLGYAQTTGTNGIAGAYLAVGLDAAGGFSSATDGRGAGCAQAAPGVRPNSVVLRGTGQGTSGYCYLTGSTLAGGRTLHSTVATASTGAPPATAGRTVRITVSAAALPVVTVYHGASAGLADSALTQVLQYTLTTAPPSSVKVGFTASTGTSTDTHLIRNVRVASVAPTSTIIQLTKTVNPGFPQPAAYAEGDTVRYQFVIAAPQLLSVINDVRLTDPLVPSPSCTASAFLLAGSITCTGTHVVSPAEAMQGSLVNTAVASGQPLLGGRISSNADSVRVAIATPAPGLSLAKTGTLADADGNGKADVGETIAYSFTARNTGNVSLQSVAVTDPRVTGITPANATLAPGASAVFTAAAYTVTQADLQAGTTLVNTATATGRTLAGAAAPTATSTATVAVNHGPALTVTKDAVLTGGAAVGATIDYSFRITNSGNVPLTGVALTDPLAGLSAITYGTWPGTAGSLPIGGSVTATARYTVKQTDLDAGSVANTATARGTSPAGIAASGQATRNVSLARTATIALTKTASVANVPAAGSPITYTFRATNTGTTTLTGVSVSDPRPGVSAPVYTWPGTAGTLAPGQVVTATSTYAATAADVQAGSIVNTATVRATTSAGATITQTATATVTAVPDPLPDAATTTQGVPVVIDVLANDGRAATGATLSRAQQSATPTLVGGASGPVPASPVSGSVTCVATGTERGRCTYRSADFFTGTDVFDYSLSSSVGTWNVRVTVTVTPLNRAAVARPDRIVATTGGPAVSVDPTLNDTDPDGDALAVTGATPPSGLRGTFSCAATACTYTPAADGWTGTIVIPYSATDRPSAPGTGIVVSSTITVFVDPAPLAPRGFHHRDTATQAAGTGSWTSTTTIGTATPSCVAGRPSTALAWAATPGATAFLVERRVAGATPGAWMAVARLGAEAIGFVDDRVGESRSYQWRVRPDLHRWTGVASAATAAVTQPAAVDARGC
ncbi:DUF7507 domain-containing protein [Clavibacter michiganensis]|uniref:DUF7507 domain-containing protein n=1 Tax=Clavibacter michiganensis TaxID=28447 RepID=UPI0021579D8F|nr:Ig-like domain-containing protein [Clavibacter michiganensis]